VILTRVSGWFKAPGSAATLKIIAVKDEGLDGPALPDGAESHQDHLPPLAADRATPISG
jgi:hypothetical protein